MVLYKVLGLIFLGIGFFILSFHYNKKFLDWVVFQSMGTRDYIYRMLKEKMFMEVTQQTILVIQIFLSIGLGLLVFLMFLPKMFPAILFGVSITIAGWKAPVPIIDFLYKKRTDKLVLQMVDALGMMANGIRSGRSITQSIDIVVSEMPDPIRQEFDFLLKRIQVGATLEECLNEFAERVDSDDIDVFVSSTIILEKTGGNKAEAFDNIVDTIRERIRVEKKIETMVTMQLTQGMVLLCMPPAMLMLLTVSDPVFMAPLYDTIIGNILLFLVLVLEVVGLFAILKITKIEV